ncbi:conserved hypothetical protein [Ricinus communis]|uniref:Uncharacterized protein n=1 Tax=Ricinus communis TaxID=3988 RepID=B9SQM2_RICCO|nr:conserved hypothetical protein [Ricinus communis]
MSTWTKKYKQNNLRKLEAGVEACCADSKLYNPASDDDSSSEEEVISAPSSDKGSEKPKAPGYFELKIGKAHLIWSFLAAHLIVKKRQNRCATRQLRNLGGLSSWYQWLGWSLLLQKEGRPDFSNYGLIAKKIMPKMGCDLENPVRVKNGKGIKEKGLDEGTKVDIRRRLGSQLFDVRPRVHPKL